MKEKGGQKEKLNVSQEVEDFKKTGPDKMKKR